ncbi:MAG: extracellular solute-binding protein [Turicibacter sp.]|nr:extracellular solute-binding protein [Turicibacter sp.]
MKRVVLMAALMAVVMVVAACGTGADAPATGAAGGQQGAAPAGEAAGGGDGAASDRPFSELSVLTWDRGGIGHVDSANNFFTQWIQEEVLRELNMQVTFQAIGRWDEGEVLPTLMAAGEAPDLAMTFNGGMVEHFGNLGGILDMSPLLEEHLHRLPSLNSWLDDLLWQNQNPTTNEIFSIMQRRVHTPRMVTNIRADWLEALNMDLPTTTDEYINALRAFRDNADVLGVDNLIPLVTTDDIRWRMGGLLETFIDPSLSDAEIWMYTIGDRHFLLPGYGDGVRLLSQMFDEGLIFPDFPVHTGDEFTDNLTIANQVGSYTHNWDQLWRPNPDIMNRLNEVDPNARFVPIDTFQNPITGQSQKITYPTSGFHVFIPATSSNPVGALEYLDWMSRLDNRLFLQIGVEGYHHERIVVDGIETVAMLMVDNDTTEMRVYSPNNIDLTLVINGVDLGNYYANIAMLTGNYPGIDPALIMDSYNIAMSNARVPVHHAIPGGTPVSSEFGPTFQQMTSQALTNIIVAPVENFDAMWEEAVQGMLGAGAQNALDERRAGLEAMGISVPDLRPGQLLNP